MSVDQFTAVMIALATLLSAIAALFAQIVSLRKKVDGRLTELLAVTRAAAQLKGELAGRDYTPPASVAEAE